MTTAQRRLAVHLLEMAANEFSAHGCTDLRLRSAVKLTADEAREIKAWIDATMRNAEDEPPNLEDEYVDNWIAMLAVAKLLGGESSDDAAAIATRVQVDLARVAGRLEAIERMGAAYGLPGDELDQERRWAEGSR